MTLRRANVVRSEFREQSVQCHGGARPHGTVEQPKAECVGATRELILGDGLELQFEAVSSRAFNP